VDRSAQIADLIARHGGGEISAGGLPGLLMLHTATPTEPLPQMARPSVAFVFGGAKRTLVGDRELRYGAGQYLVVCVDLPLTAHISQASAVEPFLGVGLELDPTAIAALLLEAGPARGADDHPPLGIAVSDADPPLLDALARLMALLDDPAEAPALRPAYERELMWRLLCGPQGPLVRQIGLADSRLSHVGRAIRFIRAHYAEPLRIERLAALAAMSPSTLHRHFRAVTGMTPIQFQKQIRLQAARDRLLSAPDDVAGAGFAVGYESASQFNREYRRLFGAPPGRDARMRRAAAA
jgi:AraC-like DNA-binding protein